MRFDCESVYFRVATHNCFTLQILQTGQSEQLIENDFETIYQLIENLFEISFSTIRAIHTTLNDELKLVVNKWIKGWIFYTGILLKALERQFCFARRLAILASRMLTCGTYYSIKNINDN